MIVIFHILLQGTLAKCILSTVSYADQPSISNNRGGCRIGIRPPEDQLKLPVIHLPTIV